MHQYDEKQSPLFYAWDKKKQQQKQHNDNSTHSGE